MILLYSNLKFYEYVINLINNNMCNKDSGEWDISRYITLVSVITTRVIIPIEKILINRNVLVFLPNLAATPSPALSDHKPWLIMIVVVPNT